MHNKRCAVRCLGLTVALLLGGSAVFATDFDFEDVFVHDNDVASVWFTVGADSFVTVFTSSWIQGEPSSEVPQEMLGFDPVVGIWDATTGDLWALGDNGGSVGNMLSNGVSYAFGVWDVYFQVPLSAGDYEATVTQSDNNPQGTSRSDGFKYDSGPDDFTAGWGPGDRFNGIWGRDGDDPRNGNWALHITNVNAAQTVPEPSTWVLLGLAGLLVARLQRRRS